MKINGFFVFPVLILLFPEYNYVFPCHFMKNSAYVIGISEKGDCHMNTCSQPRCGRMPYPAPEPCAKTPRQTDNFALAMAYVPMQKFKNLYELDEGLQHGTIFPELNKPCMGWNGGRPC